MGTMPYSQALSNNLEKPQSIKSCVNNKNGSNKTFFFLEIYCYWYATYYIYIVETPP